MTSTIHPKIRQDYENSLNYSDVFIVPDYSEVVTRKDVNISSELGGIKIPVPVISANMESVTDERMCLALRKAGALGALHRFQSIEENCRQFTHNHLDTTTTLPTLVSVGVNRDSYDRIRALYEVGARYFVIDIAHGHSLYMKETIRNLKELYPDVFVIAGNVATLEGARDLVIWGADAVKCGIGPGCFAAGTRILMATGVYKNIENILPGERVINKNGIPVTVKRSFCTGIKKVLSLRNNHFYSSTFVTGDHQYWVGDCSTSVKSLSGLGYKRTLERLTKKKESKFKWLSADKLNKNTVGLLPKNILFEMPSDFSIDLKKWHKGNYKSGFEYKTDNTLKPSYNLGYIFGTFLGDGCAHSTVWRGSHRGAVSWYFSKNESSIANKLVSCLKKCVKTTSSIQIKEKSNILIVSFYYKPFSDFLMSFGKGPDKHLPENLLVNNKFYLRGLYDGLLDSDGHISEGVECLTNTSPRLIELFSVLTHRLKGYFPLVYSRKPSIGGLKNCELANTNVSYRTKSMLRPQNRLLKDNQIVKILETKSTALEIPVYDLEVDCPTHSFIANNMIVHNSVCLTKNITGAHVPGFESVLRCAEGVRLANLVQNKEDGKRAVLIADGGFTEIGDTCKALGCGADFIMTGKLLAACDEAPQGRIYRGSASRDVQETYRNDKQMPTPEGKSEILEPTGPVAGVIEHIAGGIRSAFSYVGAHNIEEFHKKCRFGIKHRS